MVESEAQRSLETCPRSLNHMKRWVLSEKTQSEDHKIVNVQVEENSVLIIPLISILSMAMALMQYVWQVCQRLKNSSLIMESLNLMQNIYNWFIILINKTSTFLNYNYRSHSGLPVSLPLYTW